MPLSPKQLAANRANASRTTGPRSPESNARSAQNSRKHGFTATTFAVVRLEEIDEVAASRTTSSPATSPSTPRISSPSSASPPPSRPSSAPPASKTACSPPASMSPSPAAASPWSGSARNSATAIWKSPRSIPATTSWPKASIASSTTPIVGPSSCATRPRPNASGCPLGRAPSRISKGSKRSATNYQTNPLWRPNPNQRKPLASRAQRSRLPPKIPPPSRRLPPHPPNPRCNPRPSPPARSGFHRNTRTQGSRYPRSPDAA